jgi:hypothetical protein
VIFACQIDSVHMAFLLDTIRKTFLWNYARNTWEWDILCVVILIFIFLTPKSWFENSERRQVAAHQIPMSTLLVGPEVIENAGDKGTLQDRVRALTGRSDAQVIEVRKLIGGDGRARAYEVDIR